MQVRSRDEIGRLESGPTKPSLSVVLITKNQRWNVDRLVNSVLRETDAMRAEVILVDSASTDGTAAQASKHPIRVIRLNAGQHLSPSAGRFTGFRQTSGDFVLFLDGDAELYPGWLSRAVDLLNRQPDVAAVGGRRISLSLEASDEHKPALEAIPADRHNEVSHFGGSGLYRRSVLNSVGTFHPFLHSDEEPELMIRIRQAGHRVVRLDHPIVWDYTDPLDRISTLMGRRDRNLYLGFGQCLRLHLFRPTMRRYMFERGYGLGPIAAAVAAVVVGAIGIGQQKYEALVWLAAVTFAVVLLDALRKGSLYRTVHSLIGRAFLAEGTVRGFFLPTPAPESYDPTFEIIRGD